MFGVGIYYHANLWPDHQAMWSGGWTNWRIWTIIYYPYWQLYGDLNLEELNGTTPFFHVLSMNTIQMVICIICMMVLCTNSNNVVILKSTIYPLNDLTVNKNYFVDLCKLHHTLVGKHSDIYSRCGISIIETFEN